MIWWFGMVIVGGSFIIFLAVERVMWYDANVPFDALANPYLC